MVKENILALNSYNKMLSQYNHNK